jgi:SAM-dependent methyltransferase
VDPYYRPDLAYAHHRGFGFHADLCAPALVELLEPVRERDGLVVELGCGSGLLTRYLLDAGHRVVATDASPSMLELARAYVPEVHELRRLTLPDDPIPPADAVVSVGHVLSYLPDEAAVERALGAAADAVRPGGLLALDLCDLEWGAVREGQRPMGWVEDDWALVTETSVPTPASCGRWPSSAGPAPAPGAAMTSAMTTSWWTRGPCRRCSARTGSTPGWVTLSAPRSSRRD